MDFLKEALDFIVARIRSKGNPIPSHGRIPAEKVFVDVFAY